ncbi:Swt1 family HEPN domain-containing protein [Flammeovirga sp. OC4]|uniref:Swt1 family HEPN domain-containing protein n=1 Tax=Flammeovirga sp. OC4 TaxID=1382345 RepID=UPI0005C700E7|nr:Swt1 family HEPN domain-containing protein [Flammeovirga sp. OC4]
MSDFTYIKPDEEKYFNAIIKVLEGKNKTLSDKLKKGKCTISESSSFSQRRWNGMMTTIYLYVPFDIIGQINEEEKKMLLEVCELVMPKEVGFDVTDIEISPLLDSVTANKTLLDDLNQITQNESYAIIQSLPENIKANGQKMSEVYSYLYCIENTLRIFIEKVGKENHGQEYFNTFSISGSVRRKIDQRKQEEAKNQWICVRGDSDLFYLDFKELGDIIINNWNDFKTFFPDQAFVTSKINELARCRNLVAHNSMITESERDLLRLYYNQFLSQINGTRLE